MQFSKKMDRPTKRISNKDIQDSKKLIDLIQLSIVTRFKYTRKFIKINRVRGNREKFVYKYIGYLERCLATEILEFLEITT